MVLAAIGQICSTPSMTHNLEQCVSLIKKASLAGAKVIFLPEASDYIALNTNDSVATAKPQSKSPFILGLRHAADMWGIAVTVGIHDPVPDPTFNVEDNMRPMAQFPKLYNRTIYIDAQGGIKPEAEYSKIHLFDYAAAGLFESAGTERGTRLTPPFATPVGRVGAQICFDLRFAESSVALGQPAKGKDGKAKWEPAQILAYPSAFTVPTGRAHWEVLLRARAIESQCFVIAAAQVGKHHSGGRTSYGHSMAIDPWGKVLCRLKGVDEDGNVPDGAIGQLGLVDIDLGEWEKVREKMPLVRRTDIYPEM